jgi:hypothetical protein
VEISKISQKPESGLYGIWPYPAASGALRVAFVFVGCWELLGRGLMSNGLIAPKAKARHVVYSVILLLITS